jgi:hypothetical protein
LVFQSQNLEKRSPARKSEQGWQSKEPSRLAYDAKIVSRQTVPLVWDQFVLNFLTFIQTGKASPLNRRNVNECVLGTVGRFDETKPFYRVEPFYFASGHLELSLQCVPAWIAASHSIALVERHWVEP